MISILIVEDEVLIAEYLKDTISSYGYHNIRLAHTKEDALHEIHKAMPSMILLDIRIEDELDGLVIAEILSSMENHPPFIFISAHADADIVRQAINTQPAAYLTKPFKDMDVYAAISLSLGKTGNKAHKFVFKDGYTTVAVQYMDILFIESSGNYISIHTDSTKYTIRQSLEWCLSQLPDSMFQKIHRSFIVNTSKIDKIDSKYVYIEGHAIPKSRNKSFTIK